METHRSGDNDPQRLRLVQFTDCHVGSLAGAEYRGVDARQNLEAVLAQVVAWRPDVLIGTGDMSEDLGEASYRYLQERLARTGLPVLTLPGNHDDADLQQALLGPCPVDQPVVHDRGAWRFILLNSALPGKVPGRLDQTMLQGLDRALRDTRRFKAVFLHHQPLPVGSPWIDRYPLQEPERLWTRLDGRDDVRVVAWGHIHQAFSAVRGGITLLGAPSTAANSLPGRERFLFDPRGPACRWFEFAEDGSFETGILGLGWEDQSRGSSNQRMM